MGIDTTCTLKTKHGAAEQRRSVRREPSLATSCSMIWYVPAQRENAAPGRSICHAQIQNADRTTDGAVFAWADSRADCNADLLMNLHRACGLRSDHEIQAGRAGRLAGAGMGRDPDKQTAHISRRLVCQDLGPSRRVKRGAQPRRLVPPDRSPSLRPPCWVLAVKGCDRETFFQDI
jgi:hypothetical protein